MDNIITEGFSEKGFSYAVSYASRFLKTEREIRLKLSENGYPERAVENIITKLKEYNYIDDYQYCLTYISAHTPKDGYDKLLYELKVIKRVDAETAERALNDYAEKEQDSILDGFNDVWELNAFLTAKKYAKKLPLSLEDAEKARRFLYSRGHKNDPASVAVLRLRLSLD